MALQDLFAAMGSNVSMSQTINVSEQRLQTKTNFQKLTSWSGYSTLPSEFIKKISNNENSQGEYLEVWHPSQGKIIVRNNAVEKYISCDEDNLFISKVLMPNGAYYWVIEYVDSVGTRQRVESEKAESGKRSGSAE
jgi:hypothetical protein